MSGSADPREVLRRALLEIRSLKERLAAAERLAQAGAQVAAPVAVVGIGCRFGAGVDGPASFWRALVEGRDAVGPRPAGRWAATDGAAPRAGAFLADVEGFDPRFFTIAPREAAAMDPQHRLLLEVTWEALAHAGFDPAALAGSRTGVFVGLATHDFARRVPDAAIDRHFGVGTSPAVASGRIAYLLDLHGPTLTLDTACSSSLVAVHAAMRALRGGECELALAGGVSLMLSPALSASFASAGMLAPDGRCKSFDARADGYGRGEGAGIVVLKRLPDALRDGDPVLAVLRGSAVNQDGRSAGLTAPNGPAQTALIRAALDDAGLAPADIDYVEAHGTGTPLGDPIEWHALAAAFAGRDRTVWIGAAKTQFGHTEAAGGIAGLIKAVLAAGAGTLPSPAATRRSARDRCRWRCRSPRNRGSAARGSARSASPARTPMWCSRRRRRAMPRHASPLRRRCSSAAASRCRARRRRNREWTGACRSGGSARACRSGGWSRRTTCSPAPTGWRISACC
mgnify:CR=1 FL=1